MKRVINITAPHNTYGSGFEVKIRAEINTRELADYEVKRVVDKLRDLLSQDLRALPYGFWYPHELKQG